MSLTSNPTPQPPVVPWRWHVGVVAYLALVIGGGLYGMRTGEVRFGWRMYSTPIVYQLDYVLVSEADSALRIPFVPSRGLKGLSQQILRGQGDSLSWYGKPFVLCAVRGYLGYLKQQGQVPSGYALEAQLRYRSLSSSWRVLQVRTP